MKSEFIFQVYADESGKKRLKIFGEEEMRKAIDRYDVGDRGILKLETLYRKRTVKQNNLLHAYINIIAEDTGNEFDEVKDELKAMFLKVPMTDKDGNEIVNADSGEVAMKVRKTSSLSTVEMMTFCEQIRMWALSFCGIILPLPEEQQELKLNK